MFPISIFLRASAGLGILAAAACADASSRAEAPEPESFYTVTAEIALARGEARIAALQYEAAAKRYADLAPRAADVAALCLQPTLEANIAAGWLRAEPRSIDAHRAAGAAALALDRIDQAAEFYHFALANAADGAEAQFTRLDAELRATDNVFGARRLADRLAGWYPASPAALRMQGFAALRADDPAAAVRSFQAVLALSGVAAETRRELAEALPRARVIAGDLGALEELQAKARGGTPADRLDYALLLVTAHRDEEARAQLTELATDPATRPAALRVLGLLEFQQGHWDAAGARFTELVTTGRDVDDSFYYLGLVAERHDDPERALRLYARVQNGGFVTAAILQAAAILHAHGAPDEADHLLDQLAEEEPDRVPEVLSARARVYAEGGDVRRALATLERGLAEYPDSVELRYARASHYDDAGQSADALRELSQIARLRPEDPAALNALGYTLADHSRELARARALIERAHAAAPTNAAFRDSLGWVVYRQGHAAEALPILAQAYDDDRDGDIAAHLGEVLWRLGKTAEAERIWTQASQAEPDNRLIKSTRLRLHVQ